MEIGVALPCTMRSVSREGIVEWARRAEAASFRSLAVPDRLAYDNLDPFLTLAAAAAVTERIRLYTNIVIAPLRPTALLAKEIATLVTLAPGRVTIGLGVGARPVDYELAGVDWTRRGAILDVQLAELTALWAGERADRAPLLPGPVPRERVPLLIGGASPAAVRRLVRHADGYIGGAVNATLFGMIGQGVRSAWAETGREGTPRMVADVRYSPSTTAGDDADAFVADYHALGGPPPEVDAGISRGEDGIRATVEAFAEVGADELIFTPTSCDLADLDWLAGVVTNSQVRGG